MSTRFVKEYLKKLGCENATCINFKNLNQLVAQNAKTIPFENTYCYYQREICIDKDWLHEKVINKGRGGFCFELNALFYFLLKELGYDVYLHLGNVLLKEGSKGPTTHVVLLVYLDNETYLVDIGFGKYLKSAVKVGNYNIGDQFRLKKNDNLWQLEVQCDTPDDRGLDKPHGGWTKCYTFSAKPASCSVLPEKLKECCDDSNFIFRNILYFSRQTDDGMISLTNRTLKIEKSGEETFQKNIEDEEYDQILQEHFHITAV